MASARAVGILSSTALGAIVGLVILGASRADDVVDPSIAKTISIGDGGAIAATDRGSAGRTGRIDALPFEPKLRWSKSVGGRVDYAPVVASDGAVVVVSAGSGDSTLHSLAGVDGSEHAATKLGDLAASSPVLLANGLRVVVTQKGDAVGVDAAGKIRFRTPLPTDFASVPSAGIVPLSTGGFAVSRRNDLFELDGDGELSGHVKLDVTAFLAARSNGEIVATSSNGDLWVWRVGKAPRLVGTFGDKTAAAGANVCPRGVVVDGEVSPLPGQRRDRAICVVGDTSSVVEEIELATGTKRALLARRTTNLFVPFRTSVAVGASGELAVVGSGGSLMGLDGAGNEYGPVDLPGAVLVLPGKDGGTFAFSPNGGEIAPLVALDGSVLYGASDGIAIVRAGVGAQRIARCSGSYGSTAAGVNVAGPSSVVVGCVDGHIEVIDAAAPIAATPSASTSTSASTSSSP